MAGSSSPLDFVCPKKGQYPQYREFTYIHIGGYTCGVMGQTYPVNDEFASKVGEKSKVLLLLLTKINR